MISNILMFIVWLMIWLFLTWPPTIKDVMTGALVSAFVSFMTASILKGTHEKQRPKADPLKHVMRPVWFLWYIVVFLWECVKANIDVAFRVLHPDLPIRPGTIRVKTGLTSDIGLTFLANSVTLTPGTTTVDIDKDNGYIYIHWLNVKEEKGAMKVVERFENIIRNIFE